MSSNPVLVDVWRGDRVESRHRGSFLALDAEGTIVASAGDIDRPVFPRSAIKLLQGLPVIETGAADRFGLTQEELALVCASHSGTADHVRVAGAMLSKAGLSVDDLECGTHWPTGNAARRELQDAGAEPSPLHNNCSGKHAGMLCTCRSTGLEHEGYIGVDHAYQRMVAEVLTETTGTRHETASAGIDGCGIPTYPVPLRSLAKAFASLAGERVAPVRGEAARRLFRAATAHPFLTAGPDRADVAMMTSGQGRLYTKVGAEGVFCGALLDQGIGFALKMDDGNERGADSAIAALIASLLPEADALANALRGQSTTVLRNWVGTTVGQIRASGPLDMAEPA